MDVSTRPFPTALMELLAEREMSGRELERVVRRKTKRGLSTWTIVKLGKGEFLPTRRVMEAIATGLNISPEHFAEYRLLKARDELDPEVVSLKAALANLEKYRA